MVRRTRGASFMADAWVFPGGRVDEADGAGEDRFAVAAARELREEAGIDLPAASLIRFAHWITPSAEPKRFDAQFFVAPMQGTQVARHDAQETVDAQWATPSALLERYTRGELKLPPPTLRNLEDLAPHKTVATALDWARTRAVTPILPKLVPIGNTLAIVLPWDPEYSSLPGDGQPIDVSHAVAQGACRFVLENGRWWGRAP